MRFVVAALFAFVAACSPPPAKPVPAEPPPVNGDTAPIKGATTTPTPPTNPGPPTAPSMGSDVGAVEKDLIGTWEVSVPFPGGKSATQTVTFAADFGFVQTDSGTEKPTKTSTGTWKVVDGDPKMFTLLLSLPSAKAANKWRLLDATHLTTHAGMSDVVYVKKP